MIDWEEKRRQPFSEEAPPDWPPGVRAMAFNGLSLFGVHKRTRDLYWDGQRVQTELRLSRFNQLLAVLVSIATIVMAVTDVARFVQEQRAPAAVAAQGE